MKVGNWRKNWKCFENRECHVEAWGLQGGFAMALTIPHKLPGRNEFNCFLSSSIFSGFKKNLENDSAWWVFSLKLGDPDFLIETVGSSAIAEEAYQFYRQLANQDRFIFELEKDHRGVWCRNRECGRVEAVPSGTRMFVGHTAELGPSRQGRNVFHYSKGLKMYRSAKGTSNLSSNSLYSSKNVLFMWCFFWFIT